MLKNELLTPDKGSRDGCVMLGVFYCSEKGQAVRRNGPAGLPRRMAPAGCRGSRNEMLSPRKGTLWPLHGLETDFRHPRTNIIFYLYIPQLLSKGLRAFFIRHISILSPDILQRNTWFSLWACLPLCGCAFFAFWCMRLTGHVRRRSGLETV